MYPTLLWVRKTLRTHLIARLSRRRPILAAMIVGSEARGYATEQSDLDIAVIIGGRPSPSSLTLTEHYHAKFHAISSLPVWNGRVVDFQFFYQDDPELLTYDTLPLSEEKGKKQ